MSLIDSFMFGCSAFVMIGVMGICLAFIITTNSFKPTNAIARFQMVALAIMFISMVGSISINFYLIASNLKICKDSEGIRVIQKNLSGNVIRLDKSFIGKRGINHE